MHTLARMRPVKKIRNDKCQIQYIKVLRKIQDPRNVEIRVRNNRALINRALRQYSPEQQYLEEVETVQQCPEIMKT